MRYFKWAGLLAAFLLVITCFLPWVVIESKGITVTGVDAPGTLFGKPGYMNLLMTLFFFVFTFIPRIWAKRANLLAVAFNLAWAVRNYFLLSTCYAGECPVRQPGLYLLLLWSLIMFVSGLFPDLKLKGRADTPA